MFPGRQKASLPLGRVSQRPVGCGERLPAPGMGRVGREPHRWRVPCPTWCGTRRHLLMRFAQGECAPVGSKLGTTVLTASSMRFAPPGRAILKDLPRLPHPTKGVIFCDTLSEGVSQQPRFRRGRGVVGNVSVNYARSQGPSPWRGCRKSGGVSCQSVKFKPQRTQRTQRISRFLSLWFEMTFATPSLEGEGLIPSEARDLGRG